VQNRKQNKKIKLKLKEAQIMSEIESNKKRKIRVEISKRKDRNGKEYKMATLERHRLVYEANLNNMSYREFILTVRHDEDKSKKLKFIDQKEFYIHHIDGNQNNNNIENLQLMSRPEHTRLHGRPDRSRVLVNGDSWLCTKCNKVQKIENFTILKCNKFGRHHYCRTCKNKIMRKQFIVHRCARQPVSGSCL
jgi:hypothetical protein